MTHVEESIAEIDQALADMAPAHEGLRDFDRLNLTPDTHAAVTGAIELYDRRKLKLEVARKHLENLIADGYPVLDIADVTISVKADLDANAATIAAALARFDTNAAASLNMTVGVPEPKG